MPTLHYLWQYPPFAMKKFGSNGEIIACQTKISLISLIEPFIQKREIHG